MIKWNTDRIFWVVTSRERSVKGDSAAAFLPDLPPLVKHPSKRVNGVMSARLRGTYSAWASCARHSRNRGPSTRGHGAEENPEDLGGVWGMYVFGNGLASCVCERVRLCLCHQPPCMTQRMCVGVCVTVPEDACVCWSGVGVVRGHCCDSAGSYWFSWGSESCKCHGWTASQRTDSGGQFMAGFRHSWGRRHCLAF